MCVCWLARSFLTLGINSLFQQPGATKDRAPGLFYALHNFSEPVPRGREWQWDLTCLRIPLLSCRCGGWVTA